MPRGRPRKPTELHILNGDFRADRHGDPAALPADGLPVPPEGMRPEHRLWWDRIIPGLVALGVAKAVDSLALAKMVEWLAIEQKCEEALATMGTDNPEWHRMIKSRDVAMKNFDRLAARFGYTPADRARIRGQIGASATGSKIPTRKRNA